jgi:hypothetical protein
MRLFRHLRTRSYTWFAVLLVLGLLAPTLDIYICSNDKEPTITASVSAVVKTAAAKTDSQQRPAQDQDDAGCIHGHCHHGIGAMKLSEPVQIALIPRKLEPAAFPAQAPPTAPSNSLLRPPRA